jgi:hypothetical protein
MKAIFSHLIPFSYAMKKIAMLSGILNAMKSEHFKDEFIRNQAKTHHSL